MSKYLYLLVILFNLNILLLAYSELMIRVISLFNYKNTTQISLNFFSFDMLLYFFFKKKKIVKLLLVGKIV